MGQFDTSFAQNGQRQTINLEQWLAGWVTIVGGLNGVPTAEQFNAFGNLLEAKANEAGLIGLEALELAQVIQTALNAHKGSRGIAHGIATTSEAGFMSSTDKTKLDSLTGALFAWRPNKAYAVGDICFSGNSSSYKRFECVVAGTSGANEPTWPAVGAMVQDNTVKWIVDDVRDGTPVGRSVMEMRNAPRPGYIKMNGAQLNRADYPRLWAFAQTSGLVVTEAEWAAGMSGCFTAGNGSTTFRIPDGRGEFERGWDDGRGIDPLRVLGSVQEDAFEEHDHNITFPTSSSGQGGLTINNGTTSSKTYTTQKTGGSETRPRNVSKLVCIKY